MRYLNCLTNSAKNDLYNLLKDNGYIFPNMEVSGTMSIDQLAICKSIYDIYSKSNEMYIENHLVCEYVPTKVSKVFISSSLSAYAMVNNKWYLIENINDKSQIILDSTPIPKRLYFKELESSILWKII